MAILNGSYKFHTAPTGYASISANIAFTDNDGTKYTGIYASPGYDTSITTEAGDWVFAFTTMRPWKKDSGSDTDFDDVENAPWLILTFNNQEVSDDFYRDFMSCVTPYFNGILINITSSEGVTLATEKTIVNKNIKVTIDESLLNQGTDTSDATAAASEILSGKTAYLADGKAAGTMPNNGTISSTMDGINIKSVTIPAGYTSGGSVSLDNTIDDEVSEQTDLIAQIKNAVDSLPDSEGKKIVLQSKIVIPSTDVQSITADEGYDGLVDVTVNAIPDSYVEPTSTKEATTYTPTTSDQTIASGIYLTGTQTIKGDANLIAENIVSGKSIFGVNGSASSGGGGVETCTVNIRDISLPCAVAYTSYSEEKGIFSEKISVDSNSDNIDIIVTKGGTLCVFNEHESYSIAPVNLGGDGHELIRIYYDTNFKVWIYQVNDNAILGLWEI